MSIRSSAITWYQSKYKKLDKPLYSSKMYRPEESWTKSEVWFFQIPIDTIKMNHAVHLLCQKTPDSNDFYHLRVPPSFFDIHLSKFDRIKSSLAIYLSPEPKSKFIELRGKGRVDFGQWLVD